jgi:hypothetical protein
MIRREFYMLGNRVFRLITTAGIAIILAIVALIITQFLSLDTNLSGVIYASILMPAFFGIIFQLLWDFLNFNFLNGKTGRIIKLVIFYILFAIIIFAELTMFKELVNTSNASRDDYFPKFGALGKAFVGACACSCSGVVLTYTIFARDKGEMDEIIPFLPYIGYAGSVIICFILALIPPFAKSSPYIAFGLITAATVIYTVLFGLPFDYDNESTGVWDIISDKFFSSSSKSSSSYSSHKSSSSSSTKSSSGSSSSSYSSSGDNVKYATDSDIKREMEYVARNISKYDNYITGDVSIEYSINVSVGYSKIVFTVKYHISGGDSIHDEYELNQAKDEISQCFKNKGQEVVDEAMDALSKLYLPRDMSVEVKDGGSW